MSRRDYAAFGGYDWLTLERRGGEALLLLASCLPERAFHAEKAAADWAGCELRQWLNTAFYGSFGEADRGRIPQTAVHTADNPRLGTPGGADTLDHVFLLSVAEIARYFGDSGQLADGNPHSKYWVNDVYNAARIAKSADGAAAWWWTRSPGMHRDAAVYVNTGGSFNLAGHRVWNPYGGVRPALWVSDNERKG